MTRVKRIIHSTDFFLTILTVAVITIGVLIVASGNGRAERATDSAYPMPAVSVSSEMEAAQTPAPEEYPFEGKVKGTGVRMREKPSTESGKIIRELGESVRVTVLGKEGTWYYVMHRDTEGYIYADYIIHANS